MFIFIFGLISCTYLFLIYNYLDLRLVYRLVFVVLSLEMLYSFTVNNNFSLTGSCFLYHLGEISLNSLNVCVDIYFVVDNITTNFHIILVLALGACFIFLISYFNYDLNGLTIVNLSSIFSQLAFVFFSCGDLFSIIFF